jgi:acetyltransferase-like isoleucine patch superfamily enzyme
MQKGKKQTPKTQEQISIEQQTPLLTNPNDLSMTNRGYKTSFTDDISKNFSLGIEDIDTSILYYFNNIIKPFVIQNDQRIPVPIIYAAPEKWKSMQKDGFYRDDKGKIMYPLIVLKRNNIDNDNSLGFKLDANKPYNYYITSKTYTRQNAYDNFSVLNNRVPQKTYYAVVIPNYVTITYSCTIYTYYISQMNKIIEAINYSSNSYWGEPQRFKFKSIIDGFTTSNSLQEDDERLVKTDFNIKIHGYLIPDTIQKDLNSIKKYYNKTQIIITTETTGDINSLNL